MLIIPSAVTPQKPTHFLTPPDKLLLPSDDIIRLIFLPSRQTKKKNKQNHQNNWKAPEKWAGNIIQTKTKTSDTWYHPTLGNKQ